MEEIYDLWFSYLDLKNIVKLKLLSKFSSKEIFELDDVALKKEKIDSSDIFTIFLNKKIMILTEIYEYMKKKEIKLLSIRDKDYPKKLHNIENKPAFLYVRGNEKILDDDSVGIVGCRMSTNFGNNLSRKIAKELADKNINIVSGLAIGIDKYAHLGALDSKIGKTIAVLGCGIDDNDVYPYQNSKVFERIIESGGAIISEYPIGTEPKKEHFPLRNRIISGLADKVIIVEAKYKSGALITADLALEQGKDVFAIPGNINSHNSFGTNQLIKDGAFVFTKVDDIFM